VKGTLFLLRQLNGGIKNRKEKEEEKMGKMRKKK
jgi:hypothetical protein